jgi:putative SOS response-associated peptidase YedK
MDQQGRPNEPQLVYRRHPETGQPVEGLPRCGLIPHFCEKRPDFAPIHARAETVAESEWFRDAYRRRRCVVPMNSFLQKNSSGKRHAISKRRTILFLGAAMAGSKPSSASNAVGSVSEVGAKV